MNSTNYHDTQYQQDRTPITADQRPDDNRLVEQLLNLRKGDTLTFTFDQENNPLETCPDFYNEDTTYRVMGTCVTHRDGSESSFHIYLACDEIQSMPDPLFRFTVTRGMYSDNLWDRTRVSFRNGRYPNGNIKWEMTHIDLDRVISVEEIDPCPECGHPLNSPHHS
jgi:hypothetical protein